MATTETPAAVAAYAGRSRSSAVPSAGSDPVTDSLDLADFAVVSVLGGLNTQPPRLFSPRAPKGCDHRCTRTHGFRVRRVGALMGMVLIPRCLVGVGNSRRSYSW